MIKVHADNDLRITASECREDRCWGECRAVGSKCTHAVCSPVAVRFFVDGWLPLAVNLRLPVKHTGADGQGLNRAHKFGYALCRDRKVRGCVPHADLADHHLAAIFRSQCLDVQDGGGVHGLPSHPGIGHRIVRKADHVELPASGFEFVKEPGVVLVGVVDVDDHLGGRVNRLDGIVACV